MGGKLQCECGRIVYWEPCPKCDEESPDPGLRRGNGEAGSGEREATKNLKNFKPLFSGCTKKQEKSVKVWWRDQINPNAGDFNSSKKTAAANPRAVRPPGARGINERVAAIRKTFAGAAYSRGSIRG